MDLVGQTFVLVPGQASFNELDDEDWGVELGVVKDFLSHALREQALDLRDGVLEAHAAAEPQVCFIPFVQNIFKILICRSRRTIL